MLIHDAMSVACHVRQSDHLAPALEGLNPPWLLLLSLLSQPPREEAGDPVEFTGEFFKIPPRAKAKIWRHFLFVNCYLFFIKFSFTIKQTRTHTKTHTHADTYAPTHAPTQTNWQLHENDSFHKLMKTDQTLPQTVRRETLEGDSSHWQRSHWSC